MIIQIGFGAVGSRVTPLLRSMFPHFTIYVIDPDKFEIKNLTNQNITAEDVGKPKAKVAAERFNVVGIEDYYNRLILMDLIKDINITYRVYIISCVDNVRTRLQIAEDIFSLYRDLDKVCISVKNLRWVDTGVYMDISQHIAGGQTCAITTGTRLKQMTRMLLNIKEDNSNSCITIPSYIHETAAMLTIYSAASLFDKNPCEYTFLTSLKTHELKIITKPTKEDK